MKKIVLLFILIASLSIQAQRQTEINIGLPVGDFSKFYSLSADINFNYMFPIGDQFKIGPAFGFILYMPLGKTYKVESEYDDDRYFKASSSLLLPLYGKLEYTYDERIVGALHLGYALGAPEDTTTEIGGVYYRPSIGYLVKERLIVQLSYSNTNYDEGNLSSISLGVIISK